VAIRGRKASALHFFGRAEALRSRIDQQVSADYFMLRIVMINGVERGALIIRENDSPGNNLMEVLDKTTRKRETY